MMTAAVSSDLGASPCLTEGVGFAAAESVGDGCNTVKACCGLMSQ